MALSDRVAVVGYCRVSTEEQGVSGGGLETRRAAILSACRLRGWKLVAMREDVASGKSLNRPGLAAAVAAIGGDTPRRGWGKDKSYRVTGRRPA